MPWEDTGQYIRSGHQDPEEFQKDTLRTITLNAKEGIKAVIGKPKGKHAMEVLSYIFEKAKGWTVEKAKEWFEKYHNPAKEHVCAVLPFTIFEKIMEKPLRIRGLALTAGMSRNFNIYTPEELQTFAAKLVDAPVYIEHVTVSDAVGKVTKTEWDGQRLWYEAEIYDEETAEKIRKGLIRHVSVGADYETLDILDGKVPHGLDNAELSLVAVPGIPETNIKVLEKLAPANREELKKLVETQVKSILEAEQKKLKEAEWDTAYINDLPDSAFAVISKGGTKDDQNKTVPRALRHLPHHKADGSLDIPHLRNALARLPQTNLSTEEHAEAKRHLCTHAKEAEIESEVCKETESCSINEIKEQAFEPIMAGEYILGFHQEASAFLPEHFTTVWLDRENGILSIMGKPRQQPEVQRTQAIFFSKEKMWDQIKIRDWLSLHPDYMIIASSQNLPNKSDFSERLFRKPAEPVIPISKAVNLIEAVLPSPLIQRSWSLGPQRMCQELRRVIMKLQSLQDGHGDDRE